MGDVDWDRAARLFAPYMAGPLGAVIVHALLSRHGAWLADLASLAVLLLWVLMWRRWYVRRLACYGQDWRLAWRILRRWEGAALATGLALRQADRSRAARIRRHWPAPEGMAVELRWPTGLDPDRAERTLRALAIELGVDCIRLAVSGGRVTAVIVWRVPNATSRRSVVGGD